MDEEVHKPISDEPQKAQQAGSSNSEQAIHLHAAEALADAMREMLSNLDVLHETMEHTNASFIVYMDRIILLAGGTLTLTFTAVATIGDHIKKSGQSAVHIHYVVLACWLLVSTIFFGLTYNRMTILLKHQQGVESTFLSVDTKLKLKLLSYPWVQNVEAVSSLPPLADLKPVAKRIKQYRRMAACADQLAHWTLLTAFVFLVLFIQANIVGLLSR